MVYPTASRSTSARSKKCTMNPPCSNIPIPVVGADAVMGITDVADVVDVQATRTWHAAYASTDECECGKPYLEGRIVFSHFESGLLKGVGERT